MNVSAWEAVLTLPVSSSWDHIRGSLDPAVSLVEYGDYECPFCAAAKAVVDAVQDHMSDSMQFVYRHFPITTTHPNAEIAAEAAEASGAQGKFWEMHDTLFENQSRLAAPYLSEYAEALGLDLDRFHSELIERVYAPRVRKSFLSGVRSGVNGTPTFFVNGVRHDGPNDYASLRAAVQRSAFAP